VDPPSERGIDEWRLGVATEVRRARPDEIDDVAGVLADAFADYPWTRFTIAADHHRLRVRGLQRLALELIGFDHGDVWVALADDQMVGAAVFTDSRAPAPESVVAELHERSIEFTGDRLQQSIEAHASIAGLLPDRLHVSLDVVGVRTAWQRRGVGDAVIGPGLDDADRKGLPVRLETSAIENVRFYARRGFAVTDHIDVGGVEVWAMLRTNARPPR